ncbi:hypothetical protein BGX24_007389 [Mortierella sp. AD032]|nr:hypothetical protein BGX24_007389 [Mortierella sp. AD032]
MTALIIARPGILRDTLSGDCSSGYSGYIMSRPLFYNLLHKQVPAHKIHMNKRFQTISETDDKGAVETAFSATYHGDILVVAKRAYSVVRQQLDEKLLKEGKIPNLTRRICPTILLAL